MTGEPLLLRLQEAALQRLRTGATQVITEPAVFRVEGPGAVDCLQGILTNDVVAPGPDTITYGALLTPKGMIVLDLLSLRDQTGFTLIGPPNARGAAAELLRRQLPPRLARAVDLTGLRPVVWLVGTQVEPVVHAAGLPWPPASGALASLATLVGGIVIARPPGTAPWRAVITGDVAAVRNAAEQLTRSGAGAGTTEDLDLARILAGWPALGREIDERTLPQEVRFDELGGVSYTKGCYVGQETVARVHFRGHANRLLRGLTWSGGTPPAADLTLGDKPVGRLTSLVQLENRGLGLAVVRREVSPPAAANATILPVSIVELPFAH